ncbi:MAG TPA: PAS domain S-box protein [Chloroflexota bacterium]|jgi:PAS domain S-box-containing protein
MAPAASSPGVALARAALAVATAAEPAAALGAVLVACREALGVPGAALLRAEGGWLVPLASDGLAVAARPLAAPAGGVAPDGYWLELAGRVEGFLACNGPSAARPAADAALTPLLELAAAVVRQARLATEQASAWAALAARVGALEQRAAELAASDERFRTLYESTACGILVRDAAGGIVDANAAATRIVGLQVAEAHGRQWSAALRDAIREDGSPFPEAERPLGIVLRTRQPVHGVTLGFTPADGDLRWMQVDTVPVLDENGDLTQVVTSFIDVTERKQAEEAVHRERQQKLALLDSAAEGIMGTDRAGRCTFVNRSGAAMLGYEPAELLGREVHALMHHSHADGTPYPADACPVQLALLTGEQVQVDSEVLWRRDGSSFPAEYSAAPVWEEARIMGTVVSFTDITARKAAEQQLHAFAQTEKLRALGQMAGGVAHDLNQYLGLVAGHGELALRQLNQSAAGSESVMDSLKTIVQAALDGAETVKRLLVFGRPQQDRPAVRVELGELLREVAKLTAPRWRDATQAQGRPISLHVDATDDLAVDGWPESLREACTNLVFNAVDALPHGGTIRLVARRRGERIEVEVSDSGVGMTPEVQARLFEPFFSTKGERGTGLGLPMVFGIVERHGGHIAVESAPGRGTTFLLSFPLAAPLPAPEPVAAATAGPRPLRVLTVDDDPALAHMAALMLAPDGHAVTTATSGEEALQRLAAEPFDLVISDVGMGEGMNGWDLAAAVRARYPGVRFALATGWGAQIDPVEARAHGICAVLAKPFSIAQIRSLAASPA